MGGERRLGYVWIDREPGQLTCSSASDRQPAESAGTASFRSRSIRTRRAHGEDGGRCRNPARRARERVARSRRSGDEPCAPPPGRDYTKYLKRDGLKGARIGIPRAFYYDRLTPPTETNPRGGLNDAQKALMADAIAAATREGAILVDPADLPSVVDPNADKNVLLFDTVRASTTARAKMRTARRC